ncbi:MAG TPA: alpha/beta fold hydrolase [Kangiella sp.]
MPIISMQTESATPSPNTVNYKAPTWAQNQHVQSLLATFKLRRRFVQRRAQPMLQASQEVIIECDDGIKLQSFYAQSKADAPLVVLIHGWEGSHQSLYLISCASTLFNHGYNVVRLNLRDHGDSHHLNQELFHSNRLDEVVNAVKKLQTQYQPSKLFLTGFSLGGNFALRVAKQANKHDIQLAKTVAICPALDPKDVLEKLENGLSLYIKYFMYKWKRSLRKKQELFPHLYDIEESLQTDSMRELTEELVNFYGDYDSINEYFAGYDITGDYLSDLDVDTTLLLAKDDPIIDYRAIYDLPVNPNIQYFLSEHGGHCGFIKNSKLHSWLDDFLLEQFKLKAD